MAHRIGDRVLDRTISTGTGNITLLGAAAGGYVSVDSLCTVNGDTMDVVIHGGAEYEVVRITRVSVGVYSRAATKWGSSNAGSAVTFSAGTKEVWGDIAAFFAEHLNTVEIAVASATTCDIGAVRGVKVEISGTTTITSLGTSAHKVRFVRFSGALTLTHNATTLILPGAANITTAAGDTCIAASDASGNWRVFNYQKASGFPVAGTQFAQGSFTRNLTTATGTAAVTGLGFRPRAVILFGGVNATPAVSLGLSTSTINCVIWNLHAESATQWGVNAANCIVITTAAGAQQSATLSSLDSDGFTVSWTKSGSPTGTATMFYLALR